MKQWAALAVCGVMLCACASDPGASSPESDAATTTVEAATSPPTVETTTTAPAATAIQPIAELPPTVAPTPVTLAPTGTVQACGAGQRLDDADADTWGDCVPDEVAIDPSVAQAAAEAAGLPGGIPCAYPPALLAGESATVSCGVVNWDASEGSWSFVMASDSSMSSAASYVETKAPPATEPPRTEPPAPIRPAASLTDPRFGTCKEAKSHGYGPYYSGDDTEYGWYRDADDDGKVCE